MRRSDCTVSLNLVPIWLCNSGQQNYSLYGPLPTLVPRAGFRQWRKKGAEMSLSRLKKVIESWDVFIQGEKSFGPTPGPMVLENALSSRRIFPQWNISSMKHMSISITEKLVTILADNYRIVKVRTITQIRNGQVEHHSALKIT